MEAAAVRPLEPEERAEILARNPGAREEDLDTFEDLLAERFALQRSLPGELAEAHRLARLREVEAALDDLEARVFPAYEEAMAAVAARRVEADDEPPVA